ncbi:MAG: ATP-binding cassette domain-containing protein [Synergistaceae bacterium]|jgi:D-methionine transport system ATP-binding protein|nr:ATP-binding cassette domain-containing protein [Synergistaceae bacterium]
MIRIEDVSKTYRNKAGSVRALDKVNLHVEKGDIFGVLGQSGSGKSTLIRCINRLETIDEGRILVGGDDISKLSERDLRRKRQKIGMIFQHFNLLRNDTVYQNVALPLRYAGKSRDEIEKKTTELLDIVGLLDKRENHPSHLSGGQKQRVAIARALANDPEVLLCDEATSALDPETTHSVLQLLKDLRDRLALTILVITHEMAVVKDICNRVAVLNGGRFIEQGATLDIFTTPRESATRRFVSSAFELEHLNRVLLGNYVKNALATGGLVAKLIFRGEEANNALISDVSKRFGVSASVIFGNIELIGTQPLGCLYVAFIGGVGDVEGAVRYIQQQHYVVFEQISGQAALTEEL